MWFGCLHHHFQRVINEGPHKCKRAPWRTLWPKISITGEKGINALILLELSRSCSKTTRLLNWSLWPGSQESSVQAPGHLSSLTLGQSHPRLYSRAPTDLKNFLNPKRLCLALFYESKWPLKPLEGDISLDNLQGRIRDKFLRVNSEV